MEKLRGMKVTIVGSGPSGVSAAWPLVKAGAEVQMLDAGRVSATVANIERPSLDKLRQGRHNTWHHLLQSDLSGLRETGETSPKIRCATPAGFNDHYLRVNGIRTTDYMAVGALAVGGLSNVWGANVPAFDQADLDGFPFDIADLKTSYDSIAKRIGISGEDDDQLVNGEPVPSQAALPLTGVAKAAYGRFRASDKSTKLAMSIMRRAVLSHDKDGRQACDQGGACIWGCPRGAVYNSSFDVERLKQFPNFTFRPAQQVNQLERKSDTSYILQILDRDTGTEYSIGTEILVLAAGTLPSTRLVLGLQGRYNEEIRLLTTPGCVAAFSMPSKLFKPLPDKLFGLGQLGLRLQLSKDPNDYVYGLLFDGAALPVPDLIAGMPLTRVGAFRMIRFLLPSLAVILFNFPGEYSHCHVTLSRTKDREMDDLHVTGGHTIGFEALAHRAVNEVVRDLRKTGLYKLPMSTQIYGPGAVNHHAGTLPMGAATSMFGEIKGTAGLFVVDGSVLNRLPAKNHTFTVMANADRIGRYIARQTA